MDDPRPHGLLPTAGETIDLRRWTLVQKITTQCCCPYQTTMWQNYTVTADLGGFTHPGDVTGPRKAWSLWLELRSTRWK